MDTNIHAGDILIADPFLKDNSFSRSVVLMCESTQEGAVGFILNKPLPRILGELITEMRGYDFPVFYGGPVRMDTLHFVHNMPNRINDSLYVGHGIYWGGDFGAMLDTIREGTANLQNLRLFLGQSGWGENQLQGELQENTWLTIAAKKEIVFSPNTESTWKNAVRLLGKKYEEIVNYPIDPSFN